VERINERLLTFDDFLAEIYAKLTFNVFFKFKISNKSVINNKQAISLDVIKKNTSKQFPSITVTRGCCGGVECAAITTASE
jgi:hypothetical protein